MPRSVPTNSNPPSDSESSPPMIKVPKRRIPPQLLFAKAIHSRRIPLRLFLKEASDCYFESQEKVKEAVMALGIEGESQLQDRFSVDEFNDFKRQFQTNLTLFASIQSTKNNKELDSNGQSSPISSTASTPSQPATKTNSRAGSVTPGNVDGGEGTGRKKRKRKGYSDESHSRDYEAEILADAAAILESLHPSSTRSSRESTVAINESTDDITRSELNVGGDFESQFHQFSRALAGCPLETLKPSNRKESKSFMRTELNYETKVKKQAEPSSPEEAIPQPNIVITISIHLPDKPNRRLQEFQVLGNQPLTALRDAMYCLSDFTSVGDRDLNTTDRKTSPSFFFIENVFYLDYRSGDRFLDYSDPIIQWANSDASRPGFQSYRKGNMESTLFQDLSIRLNYPYSFMHQGDCEHIVIFRDVRLHHPTDFQSPSSYPHLTFQSQMKRPRCFICNDLATQHATYNDKFVGDNPCYWCDPCFIEFHYDSEDKILYRDFMWFTYLPEEFDKIGDQSRNRIGTAERSGDGETVAETGE